MVVALFRAVGALSEPPMRRVLLLSFALAVLTFAALWLGLSRELSQGDAFCASVVESRSQSVAA